MVHGEDFLIMGPNISSSTFGSFRGRAVGTLRGLLLVLVFTIVFCLICLVPVNDGCAAYVLVLGTVLLTVLALSLTTLATLVERTALPTPLPSHTTASPTPTPRPSSSSPAVSPLYTSPEYSWPCFSAMGVAQVECTMRLFLFSPPLGMSSSKKSRVMTYKFGRMTLCNYDILDAQLTTIGNNLRFDEQIYIYYLLLDLSIGKLRLSVHTSKAGQGKEARSASQEKCCRLGGCTVTLKIQSTQIGWSLSIPAQITIGEYVILASSLLTIH